MVSEREREEIECAVGKILEEADMEQITERMVRSQAAQRTKIALATREHKDIVRRCIEEFLEKVQAEPKEEEREEEEEKEEKTRDKKRKAVGKEAEEDGEDGGEEAEEEEDEDQERKSKKAKSHEKKGAKAAGSGAKAGGGGGRTTGSNGEIIVCKLTDKRRVTVSVFKGKVYVAIREYYEKGGEMLPTQKGISLSVDQWRKFKEAVPDIQDILKQRS